MPTSVVHVRKSPFDIYIGRKFAEFHESPFGNPFKLGLHGNRQDVIVEFTLWWYSPTQFALRKMARLNLVDKVLGCWCAPQLCHGEIIAGYVNWRHHESRRKDPTDQN